MSRRFRIADLDFTLSLSPDDVHQSHVQHVPSSSSVSID